MMTAFMLVVAWCIIPLPLSSYLYETGLVSERWTEALKFVSPVAVIELAEELGRAKSELALTLNLIVLTVVHFSVAGVLWWKIRQICLKNADRYLGRV
jgi:hypothetical protein